jgi:HK97 gp10 family phage protein
MLGREVHEKGVKRMMSRAAVPIRNDAKVRAPIIKDQDPRRTPGLLRDSIKIWRQRKTPHAVTYYVGVRARRRKKGEDKDPLKDAFYWWWQEAGTSRHPAANGGRGYLRPAFESKKGESVQVALQEGRKFVEITVRKFRRTPK